MVQPVVAIRKKQADDLRHSIKVVALRTGLTTHLIRAWEKRYETVQPERNGGNRRLYSCEDIQRLSLLKAATEAGHSIGNIAQLPTEQLSRLLAQEGPQRSPNRPIPAPASSENPTPWINAAYAAVEAMDSSLLESVLDDSSVALGQVRLLSDVIVPLVERIGAAWRAGTLKVAHEHIASATIRTFLGHAARPISVHPNAPVLLATTPAGQLHELGAIMVAAAATSHGWRVVYAGACLPSEEIVSAAVAHRVAAVALSIVHPEDDPHLPKELRRLRRLLPRCMHIIVGGRASDAYSEELAAVGALRANSLNDLAEILNSLRQRPAPLPKPGM
jgi:DNA-binding transcriptional MerR regulator/methylmalonyl-CoA mutase cobalamin-binding subunit